MSAAEVEEIRYLRRSIALAAVAVAGPILLVAAAFTLPRTECSLWLPVNNMTTPQCPQPTPFPLLLLVGAVGCTVASIIGLLVLRRSHRRFVRGPGDAGR